MNKEESCNVKVVIRIRPLNKRELDESGTNVCVKTDKSNNKFISVKAAEHETKDFYFDRVFANNCAQEDLYNYVAKPIVEDSLQGYNGTIFAYGQTGSGKTHTMTGPDINDVVGKGIIPRMIDTLLTGILEADENYNFKVLLSFIEIYTEKINDLIETSNVNLKLREALDKGIYIENASQVNIGSQEDFFYALEIGNNNRKVQETKMNDKSSRSHSVLIIHVYRENLEGSTQTGKLFLVDLAGSECIGKTEVQGQGLTEAKSINKSLSALGQVIKALTEKGTTHVPYRNSKLTRLLQQSLGGNSKTALIIAVSPSVFNDTETLSSVRFGWSAKQIKNNVSKNTQLSVIELQRKIEDLENSLAELSKYSNKLEEFIKSNNMKLPSDFVSPSNENYKEDYDQQEETVTLEEHLLIQEKYENAIKSLETVKEQNSNLEDQLNDKEGELSKYENNLKMVKEENEFLKEYNNRLAEQDKGKPDTTNDSGPSDEFLMNIKTCLEDNNKTADAKLKNLKDWIGSTTIGKSNSFKPFEDMKKEHIAQQEELGLLKKEKGILESKIKLLESDMITKNSAGNGKTLEILKEQWDKEKKNIYEDLSKKNEEILTLKLENSSLSDKLEVQEKGQPQPDVLLKKNLVSLERNMEYMTMMYHRVVSQKSALKVENSINEKRIQKKKERISNLEKRLSEMRDQNNTYKVELEKFKNKLQSLSEIKQKRDTVVEETPDVNKSVNLAFKTNNMMAFNGNKFGGFRINPKFKNSNIINAKQLRFGQNFEKKTDKKAYEDMINRLKANNDEEENKY